MKNSHNKIKNVIFVSALALGMTPSIALGNQCADSVETMHERLNSLLEQAQTVWASEDDAPASVLELMDEYAALTTASSTDEITSERRVEACAILDRLESVVSSGD